MESRGAWWIGPSCSRPSLSLLVVGGGSSARAVASALGAAAAKGALGRAGKSLAVHAAPRPDALAAAGRVSVDAAVVVGPETGALSMARRLPTELRVGRTVLLVDDDCEGRCRVEEKTDAWRAPLVRVHLDNELDLAAAADRVCESLRRLLGLDVGVPSLHYLP